MRRGRRRDTKASATLEFAIVGSMLCLVIIGTLEAGLLWWLKTELQVTATSTARCGAIGYTFSTSNCLDTASTRNFAVDTAQGWLFQNALAASDVTVVSAATSCKGVSGKFFTVSVTSAAFGFLPLPLAGESLSASACYPMP